MIIIKPEGAPHCHHGEREFMRAIRGQQGVYIANANVPNSTAPGAISREVDGILILREGILTVEVKSTRGVGELHTPRMDAWSIGQDDEKVIISGRPHAQALMHSKYLASFLKETGVTPGWVRAVLAIVGQDVRLADGADMVVTDNVHVVLSGATVGDVLRDKVATTSSHEVSAERVQAILTTFECVESAPKLADILREGFRVEADIEADVERQRQQVRDEYLAAAGAADAGAVAPAEVQREEHEGHDVALSPANMACVITEESFRAAVDLDDDLCETGAFVDGVAMHKRLVAYAERKGTPLVEVAAIVNNPVEVLGDDSEAHVVYCGAEHAVSVRALDGLAMYFKPVEVAKAERQGACIDGVAISARAAKQAVSQFSLPLDSVARIVNAPQERWWVPGTTDIAHARGEFVAVTNGHLGPVQYLQTRAMAVHRATPKPANETPSADVRVCDQVVEGITVRSSAVGWCQRRKVAVETVAAIAANPAKVWPGHTDGMEVRDGATHAVLVDVAAQSVVAVMTSAEAVEYRDGVVKDGVRLSGRCVFLTKRRRVSVDDILVAFKSPVRVARAPGSSETYLIGPEVAAIVDDATGAVVDFTYATHAHVKVRRGELVEVDVSVGERDEETAPTPVAAPRVTLAPAVGHDAGDSSAPSCTRIPSPAMVAQAQAERLGRRSLSAVRAVPTQVTGPPAPSPLLMARQRSA